MRADSIPGCRHFVTETAIESTFIPRADPGLLLERNGVLIHFAIPPENADFGISEPLQVGCRHSGSGHRPRPLPRTPEMKRESLLSSRFCLTVLIISHIVINATVVWGAL